jgi:hypothetical protein
MNTVFQLSVEVPVFSRSEHAIPSLTSLTIILMGRDASLIATGTIQNYGCEYLLLVG